MYYETGSKNRQDEGGSWRKCFSTMRDSLADINRERVLGDVYITVYGYRESEKNGRIRPVYESAYIDKIYFDFDCMKVLEDKSGEFFSLENKVSAEKLDDWLEEKGIARYLYFSGGGYHIFPIAVGDYKNLMRASYAIVDEVGMDLDDSSLGDVARMRRFPNTLNWSSKHKTRSAYCIPITREELHLPYEKCYEIASQGPRLGQKFKYGVIPINIDKFESYKIPEKKFKINKRQSLAQIINNSSADDILTRYGFKTSDLCPAMAAILGDGTIAHKDRLDFVKYCRTVFGLKYEDCINVAHSLFSQEMFEHCIAEQQVSCVYEHGRTFHPERMRLLGLCPEGCKKCENFYKMRNGRCLK